MLKKIIDKLFFIEYIYIISFCLQLFLNVAISEPSSTRKFVQVIGVIITMFCYFEFAIFIYNNRKDKTLAIIKFILSGMPLFQFQLYNLVVKMVLHKNALTNIKQQAYINIYFILLSYLIGGILIIIHAKLTGFLKEYWIMLVFSLYLLIWFTFGLGFYSIDYNDVDTYTPSFTYSEELKKDILFRNICNDNVFSFSDFQKDYIKSIINTEKYKLSHYEVEIDNIKTILTNGKIGEGWAGYYYEELEKKYNAFAIKDLCNFKMMKNYLNANNTTYGIEYKEILDKDYIIAKVILYKDPVENNSTDDSNNSKMILKEKYDANKIFNIVNKKEIYLIFDENDFENYDITVSNLRINIFLNLLSESSTLLDNMITEINFRDSGSSNSICDYLYFSAVVITTVGFGDMSPVSLNIRMLTIIEAFLGLIVMGLFLAKAFEKKEK